MENITPQQRRKLEKLLKLGERGLPALLEYMFELEDKMEKEIPTIRGVIAKVKGDKGDNVTYDMVLEAVQELMPVLEDGKKGDKGDDGFDGDDGIDGLNGIDGLDGKDGKDADEEVIAEKVYDTLESKLPSFGEHFRDGLELLQGDDRLDKSAIKGLDEIVKTVFTGVTGIKEVIAGTNVTIDNTNLGYPVISSTGGGGSVSSVFGRSGAVIATSGDYTTTLVTEGTNLYFTNARAISALTGQSNTLFTNGAGYITGISGLDHNTLGNLTVGDVHTQYPLLAGRSGGQTLIGGTGTTDDLILRTTSGVGATGADMIFQGGNNGATEFGRFLNNGRLGVGVPAPVSLFELPVSTLTSCAKFGTLEMQSYGVNNSWYAENVYNDGTNWRLRATGSGILSYHTGTGWQMQTVASGSAGAIASPLARLYLLLAGDFGVGISPSARLHVVSTTEQLRVGYDASIYWNATTANTTGVTTFNAVGGTTPSFIFSDSIQAPNIGVGATALTSTGLLVAGTGYTSNLIAATGSLSPTAGTNATLYRIAGTIVEAGSGTHNLMSAMFLGQTTVTAGAATVNNTAGLYIENAMTATVIGENYAIWVDDGITRLDGKVILGDTLRFKGYLVSALAGLGGVQGDKVYVTDALAPTYLTTVVGGGAIVTEVFYNGTNWVCT